MAKSDVLVRMKADVSGYDANIAKARKTLENFKQDNLSLGGILAQTTKSLTAAAAGFASVGAAIGAVTGALKVAKDAFFKNEQQLDEWGRTVEASKSLYSGFLNAINNGDISGFLSNINNITQAARDAYDALDELSTFNAFNQIQTQKARTGFTEAMAGFRMGEGSKESVQEAAKAYQDELRTRQQKEQEAYSQAVRKIAAERGVPWGNLEQALTGKYGDYEELKKTMPSGKQLKFMPGGMFGGSTAVEVPLAVTAQEKMGEALRKLNDTELRELQAIGAQAERTGEEIAQIDKQMARVLNARSKAGGSGSGGGGKTTNIKTEQTELQQNQSKINLLTQEYVTLGDITTQQARDRKEAIQQEIHVLDTRNNKLKLYAEQAQGKLQGGHVMQSNLGGDSQWSPSMSDKSYLNIGAGLSDEVMQKVKVLQQSGISASEAWKRAGTAVGLFGTAISAIKDPAAQVAATVAQAIASIALAYSQALAEDQSTKPNIFAFLAASAAAMVSMVTTIAQIRSSTSGYAQGGIVDGNSYSGDNIPIMANAGELVLTKADQASLINHLENNGMSGLGPSRISGEQIYITLNRYLKRSGQGELMTWG